jgi:hypothetical protein
MLSGVEPRVGSQLARQIAGTRHLDLDHLGTKQCQLVAAERARQHIGEVKDTNAFKKPGHGSHSSRSGV